MSHEDWNVGFQVKLMKSEKVGGEKIHYTRVVDFYLHRVRVGQVTF